MITIFPEQLINFLKEPLGLRSPNPPQIEGQISQAVDPARESQFYGSFFFNFCHISSPLIKMNAC
jgi:hypothetical protein